MKFILLTISLVLAGVSFSQTHATKIIEAYGQASYNEMVSNNPGKLKFLDAKIDAYSLTEIPVEKLDGIPVLNEVKLLDKTQTPLSVNAFIQAKNSPDFNILLYAFDLSADRVVNYRLGNTNWMISFGSINSISKKANEIILQD